jgi:hypothetical protein
MRITRWRSTASAVVTEDGRRRGPRHRAVDLQREEEEDFFFCSPPKAIPRPAWSWAELLGRLGGFG